MVEAGAPPPSFCLSYLRGVWPPRRGLAQQLLAKVVNSVTF